MYISLFWRLKVCMFVLWRQEIKYIHQYKWNSLFSITFLSKVDILAVWEAMGIHKGGWKINMGFVPSNCILYGFVSCLTQESEEKTWIAASLYYPFLSIHLRKILQDHKFWTIPTNHLTSNRNSKLPPWIASMKKRRNTGSCSGGPQQRLNFFSPSAPQQSTLLLRPRQKLAAC